jgi:hypothetical protein
MSPGEPDVYLVIDDLGGKFGKVWREADAETTDYETVIADLLGGQYKSPVRVISFNLTEGWSRDVSREVAEDLCQAPPTRCGSFPKAFRPFLNARN